MFLFIIKLILINYIQMELIKWGLKKNFDVSIYAKKEFDWEQMEQIVKGLEEGLDVSQYANSKFSKRKMEEIRLKLIYEQ